MTYKRFTKITDLNPGDKVLFRDGSVNTIVSIIEIAPWRNRQNDERSRRVEVTTKGRKHGTFSHTHLRTAELTQKLSRDAYYASF